LVSVEYNIRKFCYDVEENMSVRIDKINIEESTNYDQFQGMSLPISSMGPISGQIKYHITFMAKSFPTNIKSKILHMARYNGIEWNKLEMAESSYDPNVLRLYLNCKVAQFGEVYDLLPYEILETHNFKIMPKFSEDNIGRPVACTQCGMGGTACTEDPIQIYVDESISCATYCMKEVLE